jgi:CheY-like chemotaxis protein
MTLGGTSVLLVDDDEDTLEILTFLIVEQGGTVRSATSAEQALQKLDTWAPDVIVIDIAMPGMDGYQLLAAIKKITRLVETPTIALTAQGLSEHRRRCLEAGFTEHVAKPYHADALLRLMASITRKKDGG